MNRKKLLAITTLALAASAFAGEAVAQGKGALALEAAREYRERARYPENSRALLPGETDPVKAKRTPTRQSRRGPDGAEPTLAVWASEVSYGPGETIDLFASLEDRGKPQAPDSVTAEIAGATGIVAHVTYADDGQGADRRAGDGVWSARLTLPEGLVPELAESYMVRATARLGDGDLRHAAGGFLYSNPSGRLTGRFRDELREGSLVILAEIEVAEAGRFHLAGTLASPNGEPFGWAQTAARLEPGRHWLELSYYGLMFHDRKVAGPFRLQSAALATTTSMPNALNDVVENAHVTRAWRLEQFRNTPFGEAQLLEAAERLERANGQGGK